MPQIGSLIPNFGSGATHKIRDLDLRLRGCRICGINDLFFNFFWKIKNEKRLKWPSAWFYDSTYGLGATPYGARVLRAPYMIKISGLEHLSLGATRSTWRTTRRIWRKTQKQPEGCSDHLKYSKTLHQILDACRTSLRRARGLVRPGVAGLLIGIEYFRVRDSS